MRINKYIYINCFLLLFSCSDKKIIKKSINNNEISINWYFYSYISNTSSDFVEVKKKDSITLIFKAESVIKDIEIKNDTIVISHTKFNGLNSNIQLKDSVFGYSIKYKEITSHEIYIKWLEENKKDP